MGDKGRIMALGDSTDIDATNPQALLDALGTNAMDGAIMAARMLNDDGHPPTLSTDVAPDGAPNGGRVVDITNSRIGEAVTTAYPAARVPDMQTDAGNVFGAPDLTTPELTQDQNIQKNASPSIELATLEPKWGDNS